jgi:lipopolysaccharide exporter
MRREVGRGATWMVLLRAVDRMLGLASTVVLARLLVPEDFGLVAMAMSVIAVVEVATALGLDVPLIAKAEPQRSDYDTAWTLTILVYGSCAALVALLAAPMAVFFEEPRVTPVLLAVVVAWGIRGIENIGIVDFRRQMNFAKEFAFYGSKRLVGFLVTISSAIAFRSYWALVAGMLSSGIAGVILSYVMSPYRPRLALRSSRELLSHSKWLLLNNAMLMGVVRFPHFLIGRLLGAHSLGMFTLAYDVATMPATEISAPVNRAAFPGYSRMASDLAEFKRTFLDIGALVLAVALPAGVGVALVADEAVRVVLGPQWMDAVPLMRVLAISAVIVAATGNNGIAHLALGHTRAVALQSGLRLGVLVLLSTLLVDDFGLRGIAIAELVGAAACFVASFPVILSQLDMSVRVYILNVWRPVVASALMVPVVLAVKSVADPDPTLAQAALTLAYAVPAGMVTYVISLYLLWRIAGQPDGAERVLANKVADIGALFGRVRA